MAAPQLNQFPNIWGVFRKDGSPAFDVDSFASLTHDDPAKVGTFPVEDGGFASYDKVDNPFRCKVRLSVGGDDARMQAFLTALRAAKKSLELFDVATPQQTYLGVNLEKTAVMRDQAGQGRVVAELDFLEIRQVQPQYSTVVLPAAKVKKKATGDKSQQGKQQAQDQGGKTPVTKLPWSQLWGRASSDLGGG